MCHGIITTEETAKTIFVQILFLSSIFFRAGNKTFEVKYVVLGFCCRLFFVVPLSDGGSKVL
jgi:hypothetical protein